MKQPAGVLSVLILCMLLLSAGCTAVPGIPGIPAAATATPTAPAPTPAPAADPTGQAKSTWTGTWMTTWQGEGYDVRMVLVQSGSTVSGTYESGGGTISGTVSGNRLTGSWSEDKGESGGPVEFVLAGDGRTFAGWWAYEEDDFGLTKEEAPSWTGIRVS